MLLEGACLGSGLARIGQGVDASSIELLAADQELVLELLQGRVHRARARPPPSTAALLELLDDLVPVHRPIEQHGQDRGPDAAARHRSSEAEWLEQLPPSRSCRSIGRGSHVACLSSLVHASVTIYRDSMRVNDLPLR